MTRSRFPLLLVLFLCLGYVTAIPARALQSSGADTAKAETSPTVQNEQSESEEDSFRHSAAVKMIAGWLHLDTETTARSFEYLNFALLAGAVGFALLKILPKTFRENRATIQHQLIEARTATQQAGERLDAIEKRLAQLDEEIAAISKQAEKDSAEDEARIKASIEAERVRIVDAATKDIAAAGSAAQRELKRFTANLAVERATQKLTLSDTEDRSLVQEFIQDFSQTFGRERGNN